MKLLHIDTSLNKENSVSRRLTQEIVGIIISKNHGAEVQYLDLDSTPISHLGSSEVVVGDENQLSTSQAVVAQFLWADTVVIGVPMYNFSIPSTLKSWIDRIVVKGQTFRYTPDGPQGLVGDKKLIIALSYGGKHYGGESDFAQPYLSFLFRFLGIDNPTFVVAEGTDISSESRRQALEMAMETIGEITPGP